MLPSLLRAPGQPTPHPHFICPSKGPKLGPAQASVLSKEDRKEAQLCPSDLGREQDEHSQTTHSEGHGTPLTPREWPTTNAYVCVYFPSFLPLFTRPSLCPSIHPPNISSQADPELGYSSESRCHPCPASLTPKPCPSTKPAPDIRKAWGKSSNGRPGPRPPPSLHTFAREKPSLNAQALPFPPLR